MAKRGGTEAQRQRVTALCNAISDLRRGDLHAVLELDTYAPGEGLELAEFSDDILRGRVQSGEALGRLLENQLVEVMAYGEAILPPSTKRGRRSKSCLGGTEFVYVRGYDWVREVRKILR
jgi:hypothetical protein